MADSDSASSTSPHMHDDDNDELGDEPQGTGANHTGSGHANANTTTSINGNNETSGQDHDDAASLLTCNSATRISSRDTFMLMALWMERFPRFPPPVTSQAVRPTGCVLVDPRDRVVALEATGEAHAIVRAILRCPHDARGCDIYVSRFPCAMCTKFMVQAGIRKIYYFPAEKWEMDWEAHCLRVMDQDRLLHSNSSAAVESALSSASTISSSSSSSSNENSSSSSSIHQQTPLQSLLGGSGSAFHASAMFVPSARMSPQLLPSRGVKRLGDGSAKDNAPAASTAPADHVSSPPPPPVFSASSTYLLGIPAISPTAARSHHQHMPASSPHTPSRARLRRPSTLLAAIADKQESHYKAVQRLVSNNPIAMTLYIPQWDNKSPRLLAASPAAAAATAAATGLVAATPETVSDTSPLWTIDPSVAWTPALSSRWPLIESRFRRTLRAFEMLQRRYSNASIHLRHTRTPSSSSSSHPLITGPALSPDRAALYRHAMVLAHIAAKRTDDPKVGVGAVLLDPSGRYDSVGWNGYPKKAAHLDYPQAGADDYSVEDDELKYDYILHAEQNALLWRNPPGASLAAGTTIVSTKMPCDECSPVMADCGVTTVVSLPQTPKSADDPARFRGLAYEKLDRLVDQHWVFSTTS